MMRILQLLVVAVLWVGCVHAVPLQTQSLVKAGKEAEVADAVAEVAPVPAAAIVVPSPTLICKRTPAPIVVDGRREVLWDQRHCR